MSRRYYSKHIFPFSAIGSATTGDHRTFRLMLLNPLAPAFLPHYQFPFDPPISRCNSTRMILHLAQAFCGMPPSITPTHAPPLGEPFTHGNFMLPLTQPKNPSKSNAGTLQPPLGSSSLLPSPLQHQAKRLQAIHTTVQQYHQHLKAEQLDAKTTNFCPSTSKRFCMSATCSSLLLEHFPSAILLLKNRYQSTT